MLRFSTVSNAQVAKECHPTVDLGVTLKRVKDPLDTSTIPGKDSAHKNFTCTSIGPDLQLKPLHDSYEVISFVVSASNKSGDVMETTNEGTQIQPKAMLVINFRERNSEVYFYCIKARHKSGVIRTLKPASIKIEDAE